MPINRNQMTPLSKGGARTAHAGKGSKQAPMAARHTVASPAMPAASPMMNNYAKTPPAATPAPQGLGTGNFPGISGGLS
jgi:hypothetical protein